MSTKKLKTSASKFFNRSFIADALGEKGDLANLLELSKTPIWTANLKGYASKVYSYYRVRKVIQLISKYQNEITTANNHEQAEEFIHQFATQIGQLTIGSQNLLPVHLNTLLEGYVDVLERRNKGEDAVGMIKVVLKL